MQRLFLLGLLAPLFFLLSPLNAATPALVWNADTGWTLDSPTNDPNAKDALSLLTKASRKHEKGSLSSAISGYESVVKKYPNSIYAAEALYRDGKARQQRHQYVPAFKKYQEVLSLYPGSPHFNDIISAQYEICRDLIEGKRPRYFGWIPGFKAKGDGLQLMETVVRNAPHSPVAPQALYTVAQGYVSTGEPDAAIDALDHLINTYANAPHAPEAYLKIAELYGKIAQSPDYDQASTKLAETFYKDYLILYPQADKLPQAEKGRDSMKQRLAQSKLNAGDYYYKFRHNLQAARIFYNEAITIFPDSEIEKTARKRLEEVRKTEEQRNRLCNNRIGIGDYYMERKLYEAAIVLYTEAAAIKPDVDHLQKARARLAMAKAAKLPPPPPPPAEPDGNPSFIKFNK